MQVSTTLAGVANTVLQTAADAERPRNSIHLLDNAPSPTFTFLTNWTWARSGDILRYSGQTAVSTPNWGQDNAGRPTAAVPGEFQWLQGGLVPTQNNYARRNIF